MALPERYELLGELGRGGLAIVYRARDRLLDREVAIKMLRPEFAQQPKSLARMQREARAIASLDHRNIVRLYDVLNDALVMELVPGNCLDFRALSLPDRLRALEDIARAVHVAHERGIIHRDLKPGNVLREQTGRVVVTDFGLAHLAETRSRLTRSGTTLGTPLYMAPEQIRGQPIDRRADIYALGVMLYEAIAGQPPFQADTIAELYHKVLSRQPPPLKGVPTDLVTLCDRTLAKEPRDRYSSSTALADDLARYLAGKPIQNRPMSSWTRLARHLGRRKAVAGALILTGIFLSIGTITFLRLRQTRQDITDTRAALLEEMRSTSAASLEAVLDLRRVGKVDRMIEHAAKVFDACQKVTHDLPQLAEPHYLRGRMLRAQMRFVEALDEQQKALAKDPFYAPALYERLVLTQHLYRPGPASGQGRRRSGSALRAGAGRPR
ncbi:MAG: serine/threonine protein kinase [Planctomycetes bacterium]|nr:serine/threonine protein kinase [Planctomycetota bacterium]